MRVLILSQYFWPETFRISEVATVLRDTGCEVIVLTGQPNYPDGKIFKGYSASAVTKEDYVGIDVFRVPIIPRGRGSPMWLVLNYLSFICSATVFGSWMLRRRAIDIILVFAPSPILQAIPAIWLARMKSARLVTWVQDLWPESLRATGFVKNESVLRLVKGLVRWIYRSNDCLLVQSEAFVQSVQSMAGKTPVRYHPNPGDLSFSAAASFISPIKFKGSFNVVFTGNLGTVQALDTVLGAAALLRDDRDICFVLVGSGSRLEWVESEIARLGLENVQLTGRFPSSDMPAIMGQASVLLVSLVSDSIMSQTVPSKLQAYFAAAKPIIASLDGEGARIVEVAGAGMTCQAEDPVALAVAVKNLRDMPEEALNRMGQNAAQFYHDNFEPRMLSRRLRRVLMETKRSHG
jgi:glycosyltransferase involved in cell wall biosynthesis